MTDPLDQLIEDVEKLTDAMAHLDQMLLLAADVVEQKTQEILAYNAAVEQAGLEYGDLVVVH